MENIFKKYTEAQLNDVEKFAEYQWEEMAEGAESAEMVHFIDEDGMCIVNPWIDNTGRFDMTFAEAVQFYGAKHMMQFIDEALQHI